MSMFAFKEVPVYVGLDNITKSCTDTIYWTRARRLLPGDFTGAPVEHLNGYYVRMAESAVGFSYRLRFKEKLPKIESFAYFIKSQSWMVDSSMQIIAHEQGHFDIEEIYAKQFEQIVNKKSSMRIDSFIVEVNKTFLDFQKISSNAQDEYDSYSANSLGQEQKLEWIDEQMKLLNLR